MSIILVFGTLLNSIRLDIKRMRLLHGGQSGVLNQHVVHKLIPVDSTARVSINSHEKLVQLLVIQTFSQDSSESSDELYEKSKS